MPTRTSELLSIQFNILLLLINSSTNKEKVLPKKQTNPKNYNKIQNKQKNPPCMRLPTSPGEKKKNTCWKRRSRTYFLAVASFKSTRWNHFSSSYPASQTANWSPCPKKTQRTCFSSKIPSVDYTTTKPLFLSGPVWWVTRHRDGLLTPMYVLTRTTSTPGARQEKTIFKKIGGIKLQISPLLYLFSCLFIRSWSALNTL